MTRPRPFRGRLLAPLIVLLLAAIAWLAWDRFQAGSPAPAERPSAAGDGRPRGVFYGPPNSVAVLPFRGTAPEPDLESEQNVLAEGFAAELLETLVDLPGLQVTARTSSFFFRGERGDYRIISERLQSRHLLDGAWNRGPEGIDLTISLHDALTGRETLLKVYTAAPPDLLESIGSVCADVVAALPVPPQGCGRRPPPADPRAWAQYATGLRFADPSAQPDLARAADALQSALAIDPEYHAARLELAKLRLHPAWGAVAGTAEDAVAAARAAAEAVLEDDPEAAQAWSLLSHIRHRYDGDWQGAVRAGRRAAGLRPGDAGILGVASQALSTVGAFEAAQDLVEESVRRDPLNLGRRLRLGLLQEFRGDYEGALASYRQVLAMNPDVPGVHAYRARVKLLQGKIDSALEEVEEETDPFWRRYARVLALAGHPEFSEADPLLQEMMREQGSAAAFQIVEILAVAGDSDGAFEWLQRADAQRDPGLASLLGNRFLETLHVDPRWPEWLARLGLPPAGESRE